MERVKVESKEGQEKASQSNLNVQGF